MPFRTLLGSLPFPDEFLRFQKSLAKYFVIHETERRLRLTVSGEFLREQNAVSADHCQEGSDKPISLLEPVEISEMGEVTLLPHRVVNE